MNQLRDCILQSGEKLYRYDIKEPPKEWSTDFKNPEYVYSDTGIKNQIGAFFFFNSYHQAVNTACCAIIKNANIAKGIWITECTTSKIIKLLDLRDFNFCVELLAAFDKSDYPILTDNFRSWKDISFANMEKGIRSIEDIVLENSIWTTNQEQSTRIGKVAAKMEQILSIPNDHIGYLLQLLTDYSNGLYFKSILHDKGYEGYIFNETNNFFTIKGTDTICVFSAEKLNSPSCNKLDLPTFYNHM